MLVKKRYADKVEVSWISNTRDNRHFKFDDHCNINNGFLFPCFIGNIEYQYPFLFFTVPGVILGAQIGARISKKLPSKVLRRMFSLILVVVAFMVLMDSLGLV